MAGPGGSLQQIFRRFAPAYTATFGAAIPRHHQRTLFDIAACRTPAMGGHTQICRDCGSAHFVPHSCRHPLCPSCHNAEIDDWLAARAEEILPVRYYHLTFPLPAELRAVARSHYRAVGDAMLRAAAEACQVLAEDRLGGRLGIMAVLHTWGRTLCWHPHVHCLIPGLALGEDGTSRTITGKGLLPLKPLSKVYRAIFLRLVRAHPEAPTLPHLEFSKSWVVNSRACEEGPANVLRYLARYTKRGPLPERNILSVSDEQVIFRYVSHRTGHPATCTLTPQEFLRRYLQHTPQPGFHRIRYYGLSAPGARRRFKALRLMMLTALALLAPVIDELRKRSKQRPPHCCSHCGGQRFVCRDYASPNRRAPPWRQPA